MSCNLQNLRSHARTWRITNGRPAWDYSRPQTKTLKQTKQLSWIENGFQLKVHYSMLKWMIVYAKLVAGEQKKYESYFIDSEPRGLTSEQTPSQQLVIKFDGHLQKHSEKKTTPDSYLSLLLQFIIKSEPKLCHFVDQIVQNLPYTHRQSFPFKHSQNWRIWKAHFESRGVRSLSWLVQSLSQIREILWHLWSDFVKCDKSIHSSPLISNIFIKPVRSFVPKRQMLPMLPAPRTTPKWPSRNGRLFTRDDWRALLQSDRTLTAIV